MVRSPKCHKYESVLYFQVVNWRDGLMFGFVGLNGVVRRMGRKVSGWEYGHVDGSIVGWLVLWLMLHHY